MGDEGGRQRAALMTPGASAADVRGRQLAWLTVVAPAAIVPTAVPAAKIATGIWSLKRTRQD